MIRTEKKSFPCLEAVFGKQGCALTTTGMYFLFVQDWKGI